MSLANFSFEGDTGLEFILIQKGGKKQCCQRLVKGCFFIAVVFLVAAFVVFLVPFFVAIVFISFLVVFKSIKRKQCDLSRADDISAKAEPLKKFT